MADRPHNWTLALSILGLAVSLMSAKISLIALQTTQQVSQAVLDVTAVTGFRHIDENRYSVEVVITNFGKVPATEVTVSAGAPLRSNSANVNIDKIPLTPGRPLPQVPPSGTVTISVPIETSIEKGLFVVVGGTLSYRDTL